ncbi:nucleoside triphosphate pyrophosphohydrolase [Litoribrevibacter albus]|uniref:Nucleoside triphosphate pyrophosphohydrolase n=1 Tax=Litoribrevibacter albus TaxID=1473156 RepID=A0AA37SA20_9GAMM|nr:nucleoside triphosphate pyrophosphohydrolase [Litoribrevibacter albus]
MAVTEQKYNLDDLIHLMDRLRDPEGGCPWDLKQTFDTIVPHTLEEAYEVAEAIAKQEWGELRKELGDLIFQAIFYSKLADEQGWFDFHDVIDGLVSKMLRRHPHVFPDGRLRGQSQDNASISDETLHQQWDAIKARERSLASKDGAQSASALDNITDGLPGLIKAWKLQKKASKVGFDWDDLSGVKEQLISELKEVEEAQDPDHIEEEIGDLLFCCVNLARHHGVHPESALMKANLKFERRFRAMERLAEERQQDFTALTLDEKDQLWRDVKALERKSG